MEGPEDLCPGLQARLASRQSSHIEGLSLPYFSQRLSFPHFLLQCLAASLRADSICCPYLTRIDVDKEARRLVRVPCSHLFFTKLMASIP